MLRNVAYRLNIKFIDKRFAKNKAHKFEILKKSPKAIHEYVTKKSNMKDFYLNKLCGPERMELLSIKKDDLKDKISTIKNVVLLSDNHKGLVAVDWENSPNSLSQMSGIGVSCILSNNSIDIKDLPKITILLDHVPYPTLKKLTENIIKRYHESHLPMPLPVYENLLMNFKQVNESKSTAVSPKAILDDISTLLDFRNQELETKMAFVLPSLDEAGELARKNIFQNVLNQFQLALNFKKVSSPVLNDTITEVAFEGDRFDVTFDQFNVVLKKLTTGFGQCELRPIHTDILKILSHFNKDDSQFSVFSHMKFLSVGNNSPDQRAYGSLLDTYIKKKEVFKSIDLVEEYKANMMQHYDSIYLMNIGFNQFIKNKIPLLPLHYEDPNHFDNLHKLLEELKMNKGFSDNEISEYYMGLPIDLRIKLAKAIIETLKSPAFNDTQKEDVLLNLKRKAWYICYGIIQELSLPKEVYVSDKILLESSEKKSTLGLSVPQIEHVSTRKDNTENQEIVLEDNNSPKDVIQLNKVTENFGYKFTNVLISLASIDKDVDFARALYSRFFNEMIKPKINVSSDINNEFDYKQREMWAEIYSLLMESYGSHFNIVKNIDTQAKVTIDGLLSQGIQVNNGAIAGLTRLYEQDSIINAIRKTIIDSSFGQINYPSSSAPDKLKPSDIGFLPVFTVDKDESLRLSESKSLMEYHYFNFKTKYERDAETSEVPDAFVEQIRAVADMENDMEALDNLQRLFFTWYVKHCSSGMINSAMTKEGSILQYVEVPMNMTDSVDEYKNRMNTFFIDFTKVFKLLTDFKNTNSPETIKTLYLETFKSWKAQDVLNSQIKFNLLNHDLKYMAHTWNEQSSLNNLNLFKKSLLEGKLTQMALSQAGHEFYNNYALALLLNDMGSEGFKFIEQTKDTINYNAQTLRYYEIFFFEIEDMVKVSKIIELKKVMNDRAENAE